MAKSKIDRNALRIKPEPWERQEGETLKAYEAWSVYRDSGDERSYRATARALNKSLTTIGEWGSKWEWPRRAFVYEAHLDAQRRKRQERERQEMNDRHARIATLAQSKAVERLAALESSKLSSQDVAKFLDLAVRIERLARGESTENVRNDHQGVGGGPIQTELAGPGGGPVPISGKVIFLPPNGRDEGK